MNACPANVASSELSLNTLRNCTCGASSDPYAADAIMHRRTVGVEVTVITLVTTVVCVEVVVVWVDVTLTLVDVVVHEETDMLVIVG